MTSPKNNDHSFPSCSYTPEGCLVSTYKTMGVWTQQEAALLSIILWQGLVENLVKAEISKLKHISVGFFFYLIKRYLFALSYLQQKYSFSLLSSSDFPYLLLIYQFKHLCCIVNYCIVSKTWTNIMNIFWEKKNTSHKHLKMLIFSDFFSDLWEITEEHWA